MSTAEIVIELLDTAPDADGRRLFIAWRHTGTDDARGQILHTCLAAFTADQEALGWPVRAACPQPADAPAKAGVR